MKKSLIFLLTGIVVSSALAISLEKQEKGWLVKSKNYTALFEKNEGYRPRFLSVGGKQPHWMTVTPAVYINGERDTYEKRIAANDTSDRRSLLKVTPTVVSETPEKLVLEFAYPFSFGSVVERVELDDSELIRYDLAVKNKGARLSRIELVCNMTLRDEGGIFYPDMKRVPGFWMENGSFVSGPSWRYAWFEKSRMGAGTIAVPNKNLAGIEYAMQNRKEGWDNDFAGSRIVYSPLQQYGKESSFDFTGYVVIGGTPEKAEQYAEKLVGLPKTPYIFAYDTEKLTVKPGNGNKITADFRNPGAADVELTAKTYITYGLNTVKQIADTKYTVKAKSQLIAEIPIEFPADAKHGITIRTDLYGADGKLLDSKFEICSVTDFLPRDAGFGIVNVPQLHKDGMQNAFNAGFKKNYVGAYEYYCWAPSTIFGLAPEEDSWIPHTEAPYENVLTKKFLKGLIDDAHSKGIGVYAWLTGLWNHKVGFQHPDWLQYTEAGQPTVYNGSFRKNGERRAVLKPNIYTKERSGMWGDEFADSIDMFGWDGCRWDFTFLPAASNDPFFMDQKSRDWYDHKGRSRSELYPDTDKVGTECLKAWRDAVAKRHPDVVYGTNFGGGRSLWDDYPEYCKLSTTKSLILFEQMLSFDKEIWSTFGKWTDELVLRDNLARRNGASTVVGSMRGLPHNSAAYHIANYACASTGVKWWAYCAQQLVERSQERNRYLMRFAEYYYGHEFLLAKKGTVTNNDGILYDPFVRERKTKDGREIVIPAVNIGRDDYICVYRPEPQVRKNITFKVALKPGESAEAWLMRPQDPEKAVKLEVKNGTVTVPELVDACLVLVQCKGGN